MEFNSAFKVLIDVKCNLLSKHFNHISALHARLLKVEVKHFYITSVEPLWYVSSTNTVLRSRWLLSPYRNVSSLKQRHVSRRPSSPCSNSPHYTRFQTSALSFLERSYYFVSSEQKYVRCRLYCVLHVRLILVLLQFHSLMCITALLWRV
jgi:hypothetical protein